MGFLFPLWHTSICLIPFYKSRKVTGGIRIESTSILEFALSGRCYIFWLCESIRLSNVDIKFILLFFTIVESVLLFIFIAVLEWHKINRLMIFSCLILFTLKMMMFFQKFIFDISVLKIHNWNDSIFLNQVKQKLFF